MTCTHCGGTTADGIYLDDPCEKDLWDLLGRIPETLADARDTVARLDARRDVGRSGSTPGAPVNLEASARVTALHELLVSWSRMLYEQTGAEGDAGAEYLRANLRDIIGSTWAGECLDELSQAHRRVVQCLDVPPDYRTYGPCQAEGCAGLIRGKAGDVLARCRACGEPYDATELMRIAIANSWDKPAPLKRVVQAMELAGFPVPRSTMQDWASTGKIAPVGTDDRGRALFTMTQAWEVRGAA